MMDKNYLLQKIYEAYRKFKNYGYIMIVLPCILESV